MKKQSRLEWWLIGVLATSLLVGIGWVYNGMEADHRHISDRIAIQERLVAQFEQYIIDSTARLERIENKVDALR